MRRTEPLAQRAHADNARLSGARKTPCEKAWARPENSGRAHALSLDYELRRLEHRRAVRRLHQHRAVAARDEGAAAGRLLAAADGAEELAFLAVRGQQQAGLAGLAHPLDERLEQRAAGTTRGPREDQVEA